MPRPAALISRARTRTTAPALVVGACALALAACGSSSSSAPTTAPTTAPVATSPTTTGSATTAPVATTAPAASPTTSTVSNGSVPDAAKYRAIYLQIIDGTRSSTTAFANGAQNVDVGKITQAAFERQAAGYIAASEKLQTQFLAVTWPAQVEPLVRQLVAGDKLIVAAVQRVGTVPKADVKTAINDLLTTGNNESVIAGKLRTLLGVPASGG